MARKTPRSGHQNASGRYQRVAEAEEARKREREAERRDWKQYEGTVRVAIRAKDKRAARAALKDVGPGLGSISAAEYEVSVEAIEGPEQVI